MQSVVACRSYDHASNTNSILKISGDAFPRRTAPAPTRVGGLGAQRAEDRQREVAGHVAGLYVPGEADEGAAIRARHRRPVRATHAPAETGAGFMPAGVIGA